MVAFAANAFHRCTRITADRRRQAPLCLKLVWWSQPPRKTNECTSSIRNDLFSPMCMHAQVHSESHDLPAPFGSAVELPEFEGVSFMLPHNFHPFRHHTQPLPQPPQPPTSAPTTTPLVRVVVVVVGSHRSCGVVVLGEWEVAFGSACVVSKQHTHTHSLTHSLTAMGVCGGGGDGLSSLRLCC
jgi:hypothetical protein